MALTGFTPTYLSWADFKAVTNVPDLASISEDDYKLLAQRAEFIIDCYVGGQEKYDVDQATVFPRSCDLDSSGNAIIPDPVAMATARMVESLHKDGETKGSDQNSLTGEKMGDYSYTKGKSANDGYGENLVTPEAKMYLSKFRRKAVQISIPDSGRNDGRLNSRQKFIKSHC